MTIAGIALGVVLGIAVAAGLSLAPPLGDYLPLVARVGRGGRRWWVLAVTVMVTLLVGIAASLSTSASHPFIWLLVLGVGMPSLLACAWAWSRARSFP